MATLATFGGGQFGSTGAPHPTNAQEADAMWGKGNWYNGGATGALIQNANYAPPPKTEHWSYYGKTPLEALARQNAGAAPYSEAQRAAMHDQAQIPAPDGPAPYTGDFGGSSRPMMQNQYMPASTAPGSNAYIGRGEADFRMGMPRTQPAAPNSPGAMQMQNALSQANSQPGGNPTQNPYLPQMADEITRRASTQFNQQINPAIRRAAIANGGYGGSAQGIAQGLAASQGMDNVAGQLTNLYGTQFNADRGYGLQSDALDLNIYNANQGWMNQGQQNQLNTLDKLLGWNQTYGIGNATATQNTPLNYWQQFNQGAQGLGGMGQTGTQNLQGNPWLGALGGYQLGSSLWKG